jgi:uncharacterized protein (TIGR04255 family)
MAFPDAPRVIYELNPIEEVICQLRFPPILRIDTEPPAHFQDLIRASYPLYTTKSSVNLPPGFPRELMMAMGGRQITHQFGSQDGYWTISLARDFLSLRCSQYHRWEQFKDHLVGPMTALREVYSPAFFVRIGLRYRNVIRRSKLGLEKAGWDKLLNTAIAGAHASQEVASQIEISEHRLLIRLPDHGARMQVFHGTFKDQSKNDEECYSLDADFAIDQQTEDSNATPRLDYLNKQSRLFFRWSISDELHGAMRPVAVRDL